MADPRRASDEAIARIETSLGLLRDQMQAVITNVSGLTTNVAVLTERIDNNHHSTNGKLAAHFTADETFQRETGKRWEATEVADAARDAKIESLQLSRAKGQGALAVAAAAGAGGGSLVAVIVDNWNRIFHGS